MSSKRELERKVFDLENALKAARAAASHAGTAYDEMRSAVAVEYARHFPRPLTAERDALQLGNTPYSTLVSCQTCATPWPCREWHAYRRIYGFDSHEYEPLRLIRRKSDGSIEGGLKL